MVAWGNVPYYKDLLLAPNNELMSTISVVVITHTGNEFEFISYYEVSNHFSADSKEE